jgi:hypothetical protein
MELLVHFRDNARLSILVAVELQVFPRQRVLMHTLAADTKYRILYLHRKGGYTHSDIGRTTSIRFVSHQVVEYKV